ncbi:MAG: BON domain-containing protein [Desulfosarcinaceae bacterium]|jgi:osmotically-inducible protein OsmY
MDTIIREAITTRGTRMSMLALMGVCCAVLLFWAETAKAVPRLTDDTISDAVEDELQLDDAVRSNLIDITVSEGIVTLTGSVDNLLAKERAGRIAEEVKGVRAVVNTIRVLPPILRSDKAIQKDVSDALLMDPATDNYEVSVAVKDNVVTLAGSVDSWQEKQLCKTVAMGVKGVKGIDNNIEFHYSAGRPDSEIQKEIEQALRWDVLVDDALVHVTVNDGIVELSGTVGSLAEKRRAISNAYLTGVNDVDAKRLEVHYWARDPNLRGEKYRGLSDTDIRAALKDALLYDPRVKSFKVTAEVANGVATLRGNVDNLEAKHAATQTARNTVGVVQVINRLKVRPQKDYDDKLLKDTIERTFTVDPIVASFELSVTVRNGIVDLFGSVGTVYEKHHAEELAARINGVVGVNNYIVVAALSDPYPYDPYLDNWWGSSQTVEPHYRSPAVLLKTDAEIREGIKDEYYWSPFVDSEDITVRVDNGKATLTGTVDTWVEYYAATDNAYEGGAVTVDNNLKVRNGGIGPS